MSKKIEKKRNGRGSPIYRFAYAVLAWIVAFIFNIRVVGREKEPENGGFMVCANHTSGTDPVVICYAFRKHQIRFMAKKELFKVPVVNWLVAMLGAFPVDRGGGDVGAIKKSVNIVKGGDCLGIFPQGHRYPGVDPRETDTKNGAALICTKAEADIVPVYISRKNNTHKLFRRTYVVIGDPISFESLGYDKEGTGEYARVTGIVFDRICTLGEEFERELRAKKAGKVE